MSYLTFPLAIGNLTEIKFLIKQNKKQLILTDEGKVVSQMHRVGISDEEIKLMANKFSVNYNRSQLMIVTDRNELKMAKDKILQVVLLLSTKKTSHDNG